MKKLFFLFMLSLLLVSVAWGQTKIHEDYCSSATAGWTFSNGGGEPIQQGGYWLIDDSGDAIISQAFDVSGYVNLTLDFRVATYGSGTNNPAKVEYSTDNGTTWSLSTFTSETPSSKNYINSGTWNIGTINSSQFKIRWTRPASSGRGVRIDNIILAGTEDVGSPLLILDPSALTGFTYVHQSGPSEAQSFDVIGSNLTGNLSVSSAETDYVISTTESDTYGSSLSLTQSGGSVSATVYVKLNSGLAIGNYNSQVITVSGGGATSQTVTCSGTVSSPPPPSAPTATAATAIDDNAFTANWNSVSGATGYKLDVYTLESGGNASDLFISEYIKGSSNNKYIELYNGTGASVDLSNYVLRQYNNGSSSVSYTLLLSGTLADGATYVIANSSGAIYANPDLSTTSNVMVFNGNDALELYRTDTSTTVDIFGCIGEDPGSAWSSGIHSTENKTLVRKSTVMGGVTTSPSSGFPTLETEWDVYDQDTSTYLGSHTFSGGLTKAYVSGYQDLSVSGTSQSVTGLTQNTTYYYVVRAYDAYAQTSTNSNEIELTTLAASTYDIPDGVATTVGGATVTISGGSANYDMEGDIPPIPNGSIVIADQFVLQLIGAGPWTITIQTTAPWASYYTGGMWHAVESVDGIITFTVTASKDLILPVVLANDTTLPVELSSFTAVMNSDNHAVISWVTQTETGVSGYYVLRNSVEDLQNALQISALIEAANTSQEHTYSFIDEYIYEPGTYYYWLHVVDIDGTEDYSDPISVVYEYQEPEVPVIPQITEFKNVYPNPFNPNTNISYALSDQQDVTFSIYNSRGQLVRQYDVGSKAAGNYSLVWDGTDYNGRTVTTGVYFIRMQAGRDSFFKKAVLMK